MDKLTFSEPQLEEDSFHPFVDVTFSTKLSLDHEMYLALSIAGESVENVLLDSFKILLEKELPKLFTKYGIKLPKKSSHD